jgi:pimeloyl-ACP methyl ester carboxylesterase
MRHLGIERAHVVGHSSGGNIALQLALDAPQMVRSLAILEPALLITPSGPERLLSTGGGMVEVTERFRAGDNVSALDGFMRMVSGPAYRAALEQALPGAFEQAVADAETFFGQELPALRAWSFTRDDASRITQPVLAVIGEKSPDVSPIWRERQRILLTWLPKAEPFVLAGTTHLLHVENARGMAEGLVAPTCWATACPPPLVRLLRRSTARPSRT